MSEAKQDQTTENLPQLQGSALIIAVIVIASATFMAFLDMTIANVALPHIAGSLGVTPNEGVWAMTSFAVAEAVTVPLTGWAAARFGTVRVFIGASFAFGLFSLICGLSGSLGVLVAARICQGLAGGFLIPLSQVLIQQIVPQKHAHLGLAAWGAMALTAPIFGPVLGGLFCDGPGWAWAFFVNIPVAALCVLVPWLLFGAHAPKGARQSIDLVGLGLLILFVGSFQIMIDTGEHKDWFGSHDIVTLGVIAVLAFGAFVIWEVTEAAPVVDLRIFRHRVFTISMAVIFVTAASVGAFNVLFVLWLQIGMGYTATWAGYVMASLALLASVLSPVVGVLMPRIDARIVVSTGLVLMSVSLLMRMTYATNISFEHFILAQIVFGVGITAVLLPLTAVGMAGVLPEETASAAGLLNFARSAAAAIGVALGVAYWTRAAAENHAQLAGLVRSPDLAASGLPPMPPLALSAMTDGLVQSESIMLATNQTFLLLGLILAALALLIWLAPRMSGVALGAPPH